MQHIADSIGFEWQNTNASLLNDLILSRNVDIQDCKSVCLTLGPYRNLTTLTAATLFLHPNCQVLNHAGMRIFKNEEVDFLSNYSKERFERFIQYAIYISATGERGDVGGSIIHSHAFDSHHEMKNKFCETDERLIKSKIECLFWKESLETSNLIKKQNVDMRCLLDNEDRLLFLMPIRNPLDCAISNLNTGHAYRFQNINSGSSVRDVLQAILDEILWFASLKSIFPNRFFYYFEHSISQEMLINLAEFLKIDPIQSWLSRANSVMISKSKYEHNSDLLEYYRKSVIKKFSNFGDMAEQLLIFML